MSDFTERLAASDPAAAAPYAHGDVAAMTSRITALAPARPHRVLRTFQVRMASAVATASAVTIGAIVALGSSGPGLPVLALEKTVHPGVTTFAPSTAMQINTRLRFVAGPSITSTPSSAAALQLNVPADAPSEATRIASAFFVKGSATQRTNTPSTWDVRNTAGVVVSYVATDVPPQWTYANGSSAPVLGPTPRPVQGGVETTPAPATFVAAANRYLARLGVTHYLGRPTINWTSDPNLPATAQGPLDRQVVTFPYVVSGVATDQSYAFMFDPSGKLLWATGPDFSVASSTRYPLMSGATAVARLNSAQAPLTCQGVGTSSKSNVTLMTVTVALRTFPMTNREEWMLPTYVFSQIAGGAAITWWIVAVEPRYLRTNASPVSGTDTCGSTHH